ncbi:interleukin-21 receptor-like [Lampris incognitus]|uniref:interleukin-21 receptor-like n=1 Tax=Lampris incognitus TaxID=2546036 RepID=UPI0024B4E7EA|nr:interleukin-21 receptor-like [Lampris incognitus]
MDANMKSLPLLLVCWCSSLPAGAVSVGVQINSSFCITDYWLTIACDLKIAGESAGWTHGSYRLEFCPISRKTLGIFSCPLAVLEDGYGCAAAANGSLPEDTFKSFDTIIISLCQNSSCRVMINEFKPASNIQLNPPENVTLHQTPVNVNITWSSGYEHHPYLSAGVEYEVQLQKSNGDNEAQTFPRSTNFMSTNRSQFETDSEYCIKVKSYHIYGKHWSKWSQLKCWKTAEGKNKILTLMESVGPLVFVVGVLLFAIYSPGTRMKIKSLLHVPTPAPFFQPLFQEYRGNLQEWLSSQGHVISTCRMEDFLIADSVIIASTPILKDREAYQSLPEMSTTLPVLIQGQSSYVGLPGIDFPSNHTKGNCPEDTSYTQLPCSAMEFGFEDVVTASSLPTDFLDTSHADSGCGCEEVTENPEFSLLSGPQHPSPQCFQDDYCILNKTAEGLTPVLVPRGGDVNVQQETSCKNES